MKTFLRQFIFIALLINSAGFLWAVNPQAIGFYVGLFFVPVNFILLAVGVVKVFVLQRKKAEVNYPLHYTVVLLLPVAAQSVLFLLIDWFARKGGC